MLMRALVLLLGLWLVLPLPAHAQLEGGVVTASAVVPQSRVHPGAQFPVAVVLEIQPRWHIWPHHSKGRIPDGLPDLSPIWTRIGSGADGQRDWLDADTEPPASTLDGVTLHFPHAAWPDPHPVTSAGFTGSPLTVLSYEGRVVVFVPVTVAPDAAPGAREVALSVWVQACDDSVCMMAEEVTATASFEIVPRDTAILSEVAPPEFAAFDPSVFERLGSAPVPPAEADDHLFDFFGYGFTLGGGQYALILSLAFIAGFLLNLTPCVLPVIPIKVLSLQKQAGNPATLALYGSVYCLGIVATFGVFGVLIAVLRQQWGELFSHPVFSAVMGVVILVLGVGMLGLFTLRLPRAVYLLNPAGDTVPGNFMMGVLTAILSTPCTGPFLGGALAWAATRSAWVGLTTLIVMGVGMAAPYAALIAFPRLIDRMPRAGPGGELLKQVLGVLLIAVAFFLLGNLTLEKWPWWVVAGVGAAGFGWAILGGWRVLRTGRAKAIVTLVGVAGIAASLWLGSTMTRPSGVPWRVFATPEGGIQRTIDEALQQGKTVAVKFTAKWCANCHVIEKAVFNSSTGVRLLNSRDVVPVKVDLTLRSNEEGWTLLQRYSGGTGIPFSVFLRPGAEPVAFRSFFKISDLENALGSPR